jgi:hypothetical protein
VATEVVVGCVVGLAVVDGGVVGAGELEGDEGPVAVGVGVGAGAGAVGGAAVGAGALGAGGVGGGV